MSRTPAVIRLTEEEKYTLDEWSRKEGTGSPSVERARIILLSNEDYTVEEIAQRLKTRPARVSRWRQRFAKHRLFGLSDLQRAGVRGRYDERTDKRVLDLLEQPPPEGHEQWNGRLLAESLGDVSQAQVWRILRRRQIQLERRHSWSIHTGPEFAPKAADIVGLYLDPPESALVLSVGEMPSAQSMKEAKGFLRLTYGKAVKNLIHRGQGEGTITLSEALGMMAGNLRGGHGQRRCRRQFLDLMNDVLAARPEQKHVVLAHSNAHQPTWDRWLRSHPCVRLHLSTTYASWLNQIECWFSILGEWAFSGMSRSQPRELRDAIEAFVAARGSQTMPFEWTKVPVSPENGHQEASANAQARFATRSPKLTTGIIASMA